MSEVKVINKSKQPVTLESLKKDLFNIGVREGMLILLHSSLSSIGWVSGGAVTVILAIENILGTEGTLIMPAYSGDLSDPAEWVNPPVPGSWWNTIKDTMPPYDCDLTPTRGIGVIPEVFRKQKGVLRSSHPQVSFIARGKHAKYITSNHSLEFGCGEKSPLKKIYDLDSFILMLGVDHSSNTSIHLAEYRANYSKKKIIMHGAPIMIGQERKWIEFKDYEDKVDDFVEIGKDFIKCRRYSINVNYISQAKSQFFRQKDIVDYAVEWIEKNRK